MRIKTTIAVLTVASLAACSQSGGTGSTGGTTGSTGGQATEATGDPASFGNAVMDEFLSAFDEYNGYWQDNLGQFDPATAGSWDQYVQQARGTANELRTRIARLAEAYSPLPDLFEAEIARGGIPPDEVDDLRELISAYGTWIEYERMEVGEFLDCLKLNPAEAIGCMADSADTTAKSDDAARRIYELQASLFGITATPSPIP